MKYEKQFYVYIMSNKSNNVFYTGHANNLIKRVLEHKQKIYPNSFTAKYNVNKLVYYDVTQDPIVMIAREKQIKAGSRKKKIELIFGFNPKFKDLFHEIYI